MLIELKEFRCPKCGKLLFAEDITEGKVEIKCPRCKKKVIFEKSNK